MSWLIVVNAAFNAIPDIWAALIWMATCVTIGVLIGHLLTIRQYRIGIEYQRNKISKLREIQKRMVCEPRRGYTEDGSDA